MEYIGDDFSIHFAEDGDEARFSLFKVDGYDKNIILHTNSMAAIFRGIYVLSRVVTSLLMK